MAVARLNQGIQNQMKRAIVDLSSIIWTALLASKDKEFGRMVDYEGKEVFINSARYGYANAMNSMVTMMDALRITPRQVLIVMEGKNSKQDRLNIHPNYKAGRPKAPEQYEQFNIAKEMLMQAFLDVGANVVWQDGGVEADDVVGYLCKHLKGHRIAVSGDKDIAVLVDIENGVEHYRKGVMNENPFGEFPHHYITTAIALMGDSGDKIPGAKGFGEKAFEMLTLAYGVDGLELMEGLIKDKNLQALDEDVGTLRELQKIIDDQAGVYMSYELGRLRTEKVNTMQRPLQWRAGMVKLRTDATDFNLRKYAGVNRILSAENYDEGMAFAKKHIEMSPCVSLDIETSTPEASDEWLASRGKEDRVDVFGSELTSLQLTFGSNAQFSFYLPHKNVETEGCTNLTLEQVYDFIRLVPRTKLNFVQNAAFELSVLKVTGDI